MNNLTWDELEVECPDCERRVTILPVFEVKKVYTPASGYCWKCQKTINCDVEITLENLKTVEE